MHLLYQDHSHHFRSPGLSRFLRVLQTAHPDWIDLAEIRVNLPKAGPRQLARYVDLLESTGLRLVDYETKTRGPYRLAVAPDAISFDEPVGSAPGGDGNTPPPSQEQPIQAILDDYIDDNWVAWVIALFYATLALHEGTLVEENGVLSYLDAAEAAASGLSPWAASVVHVRRAQVLTRQSRYREAAHWLRRVETAARDGTAHPGAASLAQVTRAKIHYDQGRYVEAEHLLAHPVRGEGGIHHPHRLNMLALLNGQKFLRASPGDAPIFLSRAFFQLAQATGYVFLSQGDASLLDALCFNFGNNLLRGINCGVLPVSCADSAMQWLAANQLVCRKLGVGEDSVLADVLLIDIGLQFGYSVQRWPKLLTQGLRVAGDLEQLLARSLKQARKTGNRLEIAQVLRRRIHLASSYEQALSAYFEAFSLFSDLGRKDEISRLAGDWQGRFGTLPPKPTRGHGS